MKVALLTTDLGLTGVPRYAEILACSLPEVGDVRAEVIALQPPLERQQILEEAGIPVYVLSPTGNQYSRWDFINRLNNLLLRIKPDCLHTNLWNRGLMTSWVAYRLGIPEVVTWHYWMHKGHFAINLRNTLKEILVAHLQQLKGTHFIAIGSHIHRPGIIPSRVTNVLTGIPVRPAPAWERRDPLVVLQAAKLNPSKGQEDLLRAIARLPSSPEFEVWLAGDGPAWFTLEGLIKDMSLTNVRLLGWRRDIQDLMRQADLAVLPSYGEGLPLFVMESMMMGLPVVGYNIPPIKALVTDECGILVEPGDIASLSAALGKVLTDIELRRAMSVAAHQRAVENFSDLSMAQKTLAVYKRACVRQ
jgi:glycosyltransferase involved in cell wall biosynthesis